ncbi:CRISPR-associated helicase Cas3' [Paenibacillus sediminis]|nr:CRISPR-associated helicase Cas3' [Paenibacillus sediminis]
MIFYAKSFPVETIEEHTNELLTRYDMLKKYYQSALRSMNERDWELLRIAVQYHDVGKYDTVFQNKIRSVLEEELLEAASSYNVQHNYLSVMAIPDKELGLDKDEKRILFQAVAYHHERNVPPEVDQVLANYKANLLPHWEHIERELGISIDSKSSISKLNTIGLNNRIRESEGELFKRYVMIKGLLHRLDHAASAHVPIELASDMNVSEYVTQFIDKNYRGHKNKLQQFTESHQDSHLVVVAQTGMGKTEAGLLWLGEKKGFFTLPLRVSINAMYDRITSADNIGFSRQTNQGEEATGLLHSTSLDYLYDQHEGNDEALEKMHAQSREYANKLVISTIDQILKFPFFYLGFEKEYATVAGAKIIIDELQAYDPRIAALLVRAMTLIDDMGSSFMIMTATLPDFYYKALQRELASSALPLHYSEFIDDSVQRHHVSIEARSILDEAEIDKISEVGLNQKVLVICNTVNRAKEVFLKLRERKDNVKLLHSRFTRGDRSNLEQELLSFNQGEKAGIWVTTQLVEASLDIDFDVLYTEMSTLDSQFQRYGRCNRKGKKPVDQVNIHVYTDDVSGVGSVYHKEIYDRSLALIKGHDQGILLESIKHSMIQELYDEEQLKDSSFKEVFDKTLSQLKNRPMYEIKKQDAQDLLRDIQEVQAVPIQYAGHSEIEEALERWKQATTKSEKRKARQAIEKYTVGVNEWKGKKEGLLSEFPLIKGHYFVNCEYSEETGLEMKKSVLSII